MARKSALPVADPDEDQLEIDDDDKARAEPVPTTSPRTKTRSWSISKPQKTKRQKNIANVEKAHKPIEDNVTLITRPMPPLPLLICSIGNPGPRYANTLHSAGHIVLTRLAAHLAYPPFQKSKAYGNGLVSTNSTGASSWTLWQSPSYMNESGPSVRSAWNAFNTSLPVGAQGRLVIVHDELEKPLGSLSVKTKQGLSARGHNGLKSILSTIGNNVPFVRIGVGIGRPVSRESEAVAEYVLSRVGEAQREAVEGCVGVLVERLGELEKG